MLCWRVLLKNMGLSKFAFVKGQDKIFANFQPNSNCGREVAGPWGPTRTDEPNKEIWFMDIEECNAINNYSTNSSLDNQVYCKCIFI